MRTATGGVRTLATKAPTTEERMAMEIEREEEEEEVVMRMAGGGGGGGGGRGRGGGALTLTEEEEEGEEGTTPTQKQAPSPPLLLKTVGGAGGEVKIYQSTLSAIVKKLKDILLRFLRSLKLNSLYQNYVWMPNGPVIAAAAAPSSSTSNPLKSITRKSIVLDDDPSNSNSGGGGHGGGHGGSGSGFGGFIKEDDRKQFYHLYILYHYFSSVSTPRKCEFSSLHSPNSFYQWKPTSNYPIAFLLDIRRRKQVN